MTNPLAVVCKYCNSSAIVKFGTYKGTQRYFCKSCERKFKADDSLFHMKVSAHHISSALDMYYKGLSFRDIADHMQQEHDYRPSKSVIYQWVNKYMYMAIDHFKDYTPIVGDTWVADETVLDLDNHKVWFWDIIDSDTRFLLASRASLTRRSVDAEMLMKNAAKRAGKSPKVIITDKLKSYLEGIEDTFGSDTEHIQSSPFAIGDSTALIERFHGTLKDRVKVMRGFKDMDTLLEFTDGFLVYYDFLRPHEGLDGKTPAEAAKIDYRVKNWADVSRLPISKKAEVKTHQVSESKFSHIEPRTVETRAVTIPKVHKHIREPRVVRPTLAKMRRV